MKFVMKPGNTHDIQAAAELLADIRKGQIVLADKAYDTNWLRDYVSDRGGWGNIPPKSLRKSQICSLTVGFTHNAIWLNNFSTNTNITDALQRDMKSSDQPSPPWSNSLASASG